jgi:Mn2+/Fe2+ NRAMP family transporter
MKLKGKINQLFGPGILFAATAIGVSHLVQSTQAGAEFGYGLVWAVVLANLFKYPFFEFGSRYANVTGKSLLTGYYQRSKWTLRIYVITVFLSMFTVTAGVSVVTSALLAEWIGWSHPLYLLTIVLFVAAIALLLIGKFQALDKAVKVVALCLLLSTMLALIVALQHPVVTAPTFEPKVWWNDAQHMIFIIALMGWMPTAVDLSTWNSVWTVEKIRDTGFRPTLQQTLMDFRVGYIISAVLALVFLILGARLMYFPAEKFPSGAVGFVQKLLELYTSNLGSWSYWVILISAFSIMLSTTITVFDGYGRVLQESFQLLRPKTKPKTYFLIIIVLAVGAVFIIQFFADQMKLLLSIATGVSFVIAPIIAWFNYREVFAPSFPATAKPGRLLQILSIAGLIFLVVFTVAYLALLLQ